MKEASALGKRTLSPGCRVATTRIALLLVVVPSLSPCLLLFSCHSPAQYSAPAGPPARPVCPGPPPGLYDITAPVRIVALASQTQFRTRRLENCRPRLRSKLSARGWLVRAGLGQGAWGWAPAKPQGSVGMVFNAAEELVPVVIIPKQLRQWGLLCGDSLRVWSLFICPGDTGEERKSRGWGSTG